MSRALSVLLKIHLCTRYAFRNGKRLIYAASSSAGLDDTDDSTRRIQLQVIATNTGGADTSDRPVCGRGLENMTCQRHSIDSYFKGQCLPFTLSQEPLLLGHIICTRYSTSRSPDNNGPITARQFHTITNMNSLSLKLPNAFSFHKSLHNIGTKRESAKRMNQRNRKPKRLRRSGSLIAEMVYTDTYQERPNLGHGETKSDDDQMHRLEKFLQSTKQELDSLSLGQENCGDQEAESDYTDDESDEGELDGDIDGEDLENVHNADEEGDYIEELEIDIPRVMEQGEDENINPKTHMGATDPDTPISDTPCSGCGAFLHCQNEGIPGFLPSQIFRSVVKHKLREQICSRCFVLKRYNIALNVAVKPEEYRQLIAKIRDVRALVVVVVDVMDMPNSVFPNLQELIGKKRPLYIVGNKADLLPKDSIGYLDRAKMMLEKHCRETGLTSDSYIKHIGLVSAKTGYGVEELVTKLMQDWGRKGHVYILGCTNVGKSTLFNALLTSDYCKDTARDYINRATTSLWPGTTLNLLKFPVVDPVPWRLARRSKRLLKERKAEVEEQRLRDSGIRSKGANPTLVGQIGQTFEGWHNVAVREEDSMGFGDASFAYMEGEDRIKPVSVDRDRFQGSRYDAMMYQKSRWCYDTPGVINPAQIINRLNEHELSRVLSQDIIVPRSLIMKPGQSFWVSGLARLDYISGCRSVFFTVFASRMIPINVRDYDDMDTFYRDHVGGKSMGVPLGDADRLRELPSLVGKEMTVTGRGWSESVADILLSSIGWVAVTAEVGMEVKLRAYTPGGAGCMLRTPALLPYAINLRGKRTRSGRYKVRDLED